MRVFDFYRRPFLFDDNASGTGGAGAGGAGAGSGAGAGAAGAGAGSAAGAGAGAGAASGAAAAAGSGAGAGAASNDQGWWRAAEHGFDADTVKYLDGKNFPDLKTALSSARQADEMARNRNVVGKPDPNNLKGWGGYTELGWVADRQAYKIEAPKLADGDVHDEKAFGKFSDLAHDARLAPWQAQAVYDGMHAQTNAQVKAFRDAGATANRELDNTLRGKWGDKYDEHSALAKRAFAFFKPDSITGAQMDQAMGSAAMVELFEKIGAAMGEDKLVNPGGGSFGMKTPAQARAERLALENDPTWFAVFNNPRHAQNAAFIKQRSDLMEIEARK